MWRAFWKKEAIMAISKERQGEIALMSLKNKLRREGVFSYGSRLCVQRTAIKDLCRPIHLVDS